MSTLSVITSYLRHAVVAAVIAVLCAFSGIAFAYGEDESISRTSSSSQEHRTNFDVVMYSSTTCGYCERARRWFDDHDIDFVEYFIDTDTDAAARHRRLGMNVTPTIIVGDSVIKGFRPRILEELVFEQLVFD